MATNVPGAEGGVNLHPETRPAFKTTEFWVTAGVIAAGLVQQAAGVFNIPDATVAKFQFTLAAAYTVARGLAKVGVPNVPYAPPVADVDPDAHLPADSLHAEAEGVIPDDPGELPPDEGDAERP